MLQQEIVNKIYILDFSLLKDHINKCTNEVLWKHLGMYNADFKLQHKVEKAIVNRVVCYVISNTNDSPVCKLLDDDIDLLNIGRALDSYAQTLYVQTHLAFDRMFRFNDNVEVNVDTMMSGNNVTVFTYENSLD